MLLRRQERGPKLGGRAHQDGRFRTRLLPLQEHEDMMDELSGLSIDREEGPSWARANWPLAELDAVNLGLDPTEATLEQVGKAA